MAAVSASVPSGRIELLGAPLDAKQYDEVERIWKMAPNAAAMNAVTGYFTAVRTDKRPCKLLATWLDEPRAASVHDASNPPAGWWESRWKLWQATKGGAAAALKAITGQTFYMFTIENLRQFGTLKAMGASNRRIVGMVFFQAMLVGVIGYGIGIGMASFFGEIAARNSRLAFLLPWQVLAGTGATVLLIILVSSIFSVRRVLVLEPAAVFQGA